MAETTKKPTSNRSAKDHRNTLFRVLDSVLSLSHKKIHAEGNSDKAKQGWARVLVSAVSAYGPLLKDEELELRVLTLEEKLKNSITAEYDRYPKKLSTCFQNYPEPTETQAEKTKYSPTLMI